MRKFTLFVVAAGTLAVTLVAIASASHSTSRGAAITPTAEKAYPWLAPGVTPAGTAENNWAYPRADYMGTNYSMLKQINTGNVGNLKMAWQKSFMGPALASTVQGAPIVVSGKGKNLPIESGTMLLSTNKGAVALNPVTGETLWSYVGPGAPNGALATFGGNAARASSFGRGLYYIGQQDGSVTALNAKTGAPVWTAQVSAAGGFAGHVSLTSPFTVFYEDGKNGMVITAPNNGDSPLRGHLDAYDAKTGNLIWRWWTTPDPTQFPFILTWSNPAEAALGGAAVWNDPSIDPQLGMIFTGTGNAYPYTGRQPGKNLWTESLVGLDLKTGSLKWYYQAVHHDNWDYDCPTPTILFNMTMKGKMVPGIVGSCKTGYLYELDRRNGHPIFPIPEVPVPDLNGGKGAALNNTWPTQPIPTGGAASLLTHCMTAEQAADHLGASYPIAPNGLPMKLTCPFAPEYSDAYYVWGPFYGLGGTDYPRMAYDPTTQNVYACANVTTYATANRSPTDYHLLAITSGSVASKGWTGSVTAVNMATNTMMWQQKWFAEKDGACYNGVMATAGGLLFGASKGQSTASVATMAAAGVDYGGSMYAWDSKTGKVLWTWKNVDYIQASGPITYSINGKQYVTNYLEGKAPATPGSVGTRDLLTTFAL
jgi:glucose dehydrogenase